MQVFEYEGSIAQIAIENIFRFIPPYHWGFLIFVPACLIVFELFFSEKNPLAESKNNSWTLLVPSFIYLAVFVNVYAIIDEVAVNLEHSYNLYHYGRFSMSPHVMIDGTVELLFYLLHTPFAFNHQGLILGNFLIGLTVGWLHLFCLWLMLQKTEPLQKLLFLSSFSVFLPVMEAFASGFGNSLLSLVFLAALTFYFNLRTRAFLILSSVLPLIRPDGVLVSAACTVLFILSKWRKGDRVSFGEWMLALGAPLAALGCYFVVFRLMYGHFIATPILFKSIEPHMLQLMEPGRLVRATFYWMSKARYVVLLSVTLLGCFLYTRKELEMKSPAKDLILLVFLLTPSCILILISGSILAVYRQDYTISRYWIPLSITLYLFFIQVIAGIEGRFGQKINGNKPYVAFFIFLLFFFFMIGDQWMIHKRHAKGYINRAYAATAGSVLDRIAPKDFTFSTAEMNTFGLGSERHVIDMFGFTNRKIATSNVCDYQSIRKLSSLTPEEEPDLRWLYRYSHLRALYNYDQIKNRIDHYLDAGYYESVVHWADSYTFFLLNDSDYGTEGFHAGFLVKKSSQEEMHEKLREYGFSLKRKQTIEVKTSENLKKREKIRYRC